MNDTYLPPRRRRHARELPRSAGARTRAWPLAIVVYVAIAGLAACARPDTSYRVRAEVISVAGQGADLRVVLAHEAIAGFVGRDGKAATMPAMRMAFGLAEGVDSAPFRVGSKWDVAFDVRWGREPMLVITRVRRLPDATQLELAGQD